MDEPAKNSIWNYLIPLWHLEQVSSIFGRRGVEVSLTSHYFVWAMHKICFYIGFMHVLWYHVPIV